MRELPAEIGGKVDIVVNNAELHRAFGIGSRHGIEVARAEMDINYFGLLRLAQEFGPVDARARRRRPVERGGVGQPALDLRALELSAARHLLGLEGRRAFARAVPARRDAAGGRARRQRLPRPDRRRVEPALPPPKVAPAALAQAIVKALQEGVEDVYPGDVAQEWLARWRENPKVLERELAASQ